MSPLVEAEKIDKLEGYFVSVLFYLSLLFYSYVLIFYLSSI